MIAIIMFSGIRMVLQHASKNTMVLVLLVKHYPVITNMRILDHKSAMHITDFPVIDVNTSYILLIA